MNHPSNYLPPSPSRQFIQQFWINPEKKFDFSKKQNRGKTKKKITGFTSKAGNVFDTCLKFEDDRISFDFDNPGEILPENDKIVE